jgi:hypothetical protein
VRHFVDRFDTLDDEESKLPPAAPNFPGRVYVAPNLVASSEPCGIQGRAWFGAFALHDDERVRRFNEGFCERRTLQDASPLALPRYLAPEAPAIPFTDSIFKAPDQRYPVRIVGLMVSRGLPSLALARWVRRPG